MPTSLAKTEEKVRPAQEDDRKRIAELAYLESYVHHHPGWISPLDSLNEQGFAVLEENGRIKAALALMPENKHTAWVRLFAVASSLSPKRAWEELWPAAVERLDEGIQWVAAMPFEDWFNELISTHGFLPYQQVEMLMWKPQPLPETRKAKGYIIRNITHEDLEAITQIDALAFGKFWHTKQEILAEALKHSVWARTVENPTTKQLLGFQISTPSPLGGHLARIAVHPKAQRKGLGYWLVHDVLTFFSHQNAERVTLNTQGNNAVAIGLYKRLGFRPTEEQFQVLVHSLDGSIPPSGDNM